MIRTHTVRAIKENAAAKLEYERLSNNQIKFLPKLMISDFSLTITLLNIRSTEVHMLDILNDQHWIELGFLCLTETQLQRHDDLDQIKSIFNGQFTIESNINEDKYKSIAIFYKDNVSIINHVIMLS